MIEFKCVSFNYPDGHKGLDNIDLQIEKGSFTAIIGSNGSGKSTFLRHINGILKPSSGSVLVCGMDTNDPENTLSIRQTAGIVFQDPHTQAVGATVEEDVAFGPENLALECAEIQDRVSSSIENVGMEGSDDNLLMFLSGGQLQKVSIAGVLAISPEILIFDEVTSMLDSESRSQILDLAHHFKEQGKTIIYVTHHLEETLLADHILVFEKGSVILEGPPRTVFRNLFSSGRSIPPILELGFRLQDAGIISKDHFFTDVSTLKEDLCRSR